VLSLVFDQIGLAGAVSSLDANRHGMNRGAQHDDLVALAQLATLHPDAATFVAWLAAQLASPVTDADHGVTLATVHRVKGQEWPVVVIHEATATQFPHRLADDLEEERRLFHVAITRASHHVTVIAGAEPSPFVDELTSEPSPERRRVPARPTPRAAERPSGRQPASPADDPLRTALRSLRLELAAGKPAYTVFDDATMEAIVRARPASIVALGRVPGIGPKRLATFGERIVATVAAVAAPGPP
jgi:DNA helicase-2/ATP-dependent DNA helicase PcrA